jgi:hypothetical protein
VNVFVVIFTFQEQQLSHNQVGHLIMHLTFKQDNTITQQAAVDIITTLTFAGLF